jgi:hypothetical protein
VEKDAERKREALYLGSLGESRKREPGKDKLEEETTEDREGNEGITRRDNRGQGGE